MYCNSFGKTAPCHQTPKPLTRSADAGDQQQDSGSTNYVHQARRLRRRRPPPCQASRARKCPGVCGRAAASMPPVNETHPNAKKPDTRGLPPTARLITPHRSPIANNTHTHDTPATGEPGTEVPGCVRACGGMDAASQRKHKHTQRNPTPVGCRPRLA